MRIWLLGLLVFLVACSAQVADVAEPAPVEDVVEDVEEAEEVEAVESEVEEPTETPWRDIELVDINSGETFKVSDFAGTPIFLESFAVWCPTCTAQQEITKDLHEEVGDDIISISIDTDPNEDADAVREHTQANGFTWRYAIAPIDMTQQLIDEFGLVFISAPSVPLLIICEDQSATLMKRGIKTIDELKAAAANCGG